jgi:hypothetical protein
MIRGRSLTSNAGRLRACRRFCVLIYATSAIYFGYAPWNYLLLAVLLFRSRTDTHAEREFPST